jgi:hypothetical protein
MRKDVLMMSKRRRYGLIGFGILVVLILFVLLAGRWMFAHRLDPYIREQAVQYLQKRFDAEVEIADLRVHMPELSVSRLIRTGGGVAIHVDGDGILLRLKGRTDLPPLFTMKKVGFDVDLATLFAHPKRVPQATLDGLEINVPPRGDRPKDEKANSDASHESENTGVIVDEVVVHEATLKILPKEHGKEPLQFDIHYLRLQPAGKDVAMNYDASLRNAKPPGEILSQGSFGPWTAAVPGDTPVSGKYKFDHADLGVFDGIAGILASTGDFAGTLSTINVHGEAAVPDFRLKSSGNPVPLQTRFEVLVDGTNGNTVLKPVIARLGTSDFSTSGAIIEHNGQDHRMISLDASMPKGNLEDLLRLAMKGSPLMEGRVSFKARIEIPPLAGKVREKLRLDGQFEVNEGKFLRSTIQDKIDALSRRGQGQPENEAIDEVFSGMKGRFHLENQVITFHTLQFAVPGAAIDLAGNYTIKGPVDLHGAMTLQAKVSETVAGWKRWLLKPIDPFFSKNGTGTLLHFKVAGTADDPQFGLERGKKAPIQDTERAKPKDKND